MNLQKDTPSVFAGERAFFFLRLGCFLTVKKFGVADFISRKLPPILYSLQIFVKRYLLFLRRFVLKSQIALCFVLCYNWF